MTSELIGGLPAADRSLLAHAPLELAVAEVRFVSSIPEIPAAFAAQVRDQLEGVTEQDFPAIEPATHGTVQMSFAAEGPSWQGVQTHGWQLSTSGATTSITLLPGSIIVQTSDYDRWSTSLKAPLSALLEALEAFAHPDLVQRIGLRYVDRFQDGRCTVPADWLGRIAPSLLGPALNPTFGHLVRGAQQHVDVHLDAHHGATLRHGPTANEVSGGTDYLVDLDIFNHASAVFDHDQILYAAERMNRTALSLFQATTTVEYLRELKGEGKE